MAPVVLAAGLIAPNLSKLALHSYLTTDLAARPNVRVDIGVRLTSPHRAQQFIVLARTDTLCRGAAGNIGG